MKSLIRICKATPAAARSQGSIRVLGADQCEWRLCHDVKVERDRPVLDVVEVVLDAALDFFLAVGFAAPAVDLSPAGQARLDAVPGEITIHCLVVEPVRG